ARNAPRLVGVASCAGVHICPTFLRIVTTVWMKNIYVSDGTQISTSWLSELPRMQEIIEDFLFAVMSARMIHNIDLEVIEIKKKGGLLKETDTALSLKIKIGQNGQKYELYLRIVLNDDGSASYRFGAARGKLDLSPMDSGSFDSLSARRDLLDSHIDSHAQVNGFYFHQWLGALLDGHVPGMSDSDAKVLIHNRATILHWFQFMAGLPRPSDAYWAVFDNQP
ncbi:MAG: hypothetical protein JW839_10000, partial [Candidatus Lokiarchaeota archaeon]|nr:hypothetical protein [Candidatus Lokiarchaeota archaeon]